MRVSGLYGCNFEGNNKFIRTSLHHEDVEACIDLVSSPTLIDDVAQALAHLIQGDAKGLYHVAGPQPISRYEFQKAVKEVFGLRGEVIPVLSEAQNFRAKRPKDSSLSTTRLGSVMTHGIAGALLIVKEQLTWKSSFQRI